MARFIEFLEFAGSVIGIIFIVIIVLTTISDMPPTGYVALEYNQGHVGSCEYSCGRPTLTPGGDCFCDDKCYEKGDCCLDIRQYCP